MFARRFFAARYFAPRYFPGGSDTPPPEPPVSDFVYNRAIGFRMIGG